MRVFGPLEKDNPLVTGEDKDHCHCACCNERFKEGEYITLLAVQAYGSRGYHDRTVLSIPIHRDCYWPEVNAIHKGKCSCGAEFDLPDMEDPQYKVKIEGMILHVLNNDHTMKIVEVKT